MLMEVNHQTLTSVADAIDKYCAQQDREMKDADREIRSVLGSDWAGEDALEFLRKWEGVDDDKSTAVQFRKALTQYAEALRNCAKVYRDAQISAYNAGSRLRYL